MASLSCALIQTPNVVNMIKPNRWNALITIGRAYSVFPQNYHRPIFRKAEQEEVLKSDLGKELSHCKIKPVSSHESCSEFNDPLINKFVNHLMRHGRKTLATFLMNSALQTIKITQLVKYHKLDDDDEAKNSIELDPRVIVHRAVENASPVLQLAKVTKGGITYQIPTPISEKRGQFLAMKWLIVAAREKGLNVKYFESLARELIAASEEKGPVVKRKQELHKLCEANRAYAHFRWQKRL